MGYYDEKGKLSAESRTMIKIDNMKDDKHSDEKMTAFKPVKNISRSPYSLFDGEYEGSKRRKAKNKGADSDGGPLFYSVLLLLVLVFMAALIWFLKTGGVDIL